MKLEVIDCQSSKFHRKSLIFKIKICQWSSNQIDLKPKNSFYCSVITHSSVISCFQKHFQWFIISQRKYQMDSQYIIRTATHQQVKDIVSDWGHQEGWQPALTDGQLFFYADPTGFFLGIKDGQIISAICGIKCPRNFAFIGFYVCKKEYRGKGYGLKIFKHCMDYLNGSNISLESVAAQESNYVKSGFKTYSRSSCSWFRGIGPILEDPKIKCLKKIDFDLIYKYWMKNSTCFNKDFCERWVKHDEHWSFGYFEGDELVGIISMRKGIRYYRIGPLIADSPLFARKLVEHMRSMAGAEVKIIMNFMERNQQSVNLASQLNTTLLYKCARMYTQGQPPQLDYNKNYAVTAPDIG